MKHLVTTTAFCLAAGCASAPVEQPPPTTSFAPLSIDEFPGASKVLNGFDEPSASPDWTAHDQVLFALRLDKGTDVQRWLLHVDALTAVPISANSPGTVAGKPDGAASLSMRSYRAPVAVKVFAADGAVLDETAITLLASYMSEGLLPAIRGQTTSEAAHDGAVAYGEALRRQLLGYYTMESLLGVVRENDVLADYFWQVVEAPGLWSVITHLGASVKVDLSFENSVAVATPAPLPAAASAFSVPLRIDVNGTPALFVDLLATDARRPYSLCGGIVAAVARHPTRSDVTLRMQLIAACCGH